MATITDEILKDIAQNETVVVGVDDKVYKWDLDVPTWDLGLASEGATFADTLKAKGTSPGTTTTVGTKVEINELGQDVNVKVVTGQVIGNSNTQLIAQLTKLTESATATIITDVVVSKALKFNALNEQIGWTTKAYNRAWNGQIDSKEYVGAAGAKMFISDVEDPTFAPHGNSEEFVFLIDGNTLTVDKFKKDVKATDTVPANTLFRIKPSGHGFDQIKDDNGQNPIAVKLGWYYTGNAQAILATDAFDSTAYGTEFFGVNVGVLTNGTSRQDAEPAPGVADMVVAGDAVVMTNGPTATVVAGPPSDLARPFDSIAPEANKFWDEKPFLAHPLDNSGGLLAAVNHSGARTGANPWTSKPSKTLDNGSDYWTLISSGLEADITASNTTVWSETTLPETEEALLYRS